MIQWKKKIFAALMTVVFGAGIGASPAWANEGSSPSLFHPLGAQLDTRGDQHPTLVRQRRVDVNWGALSQMQADGPSMSRTLNLNLFDDVSFTVVIDTVTTNLSGTQSLVGHLADADNGTVTLVVADGLVVGNVTVQGATYHITSSGDGTHVIQQIDPSKIPDGNDFIEVEGAPPPDPKTTDASAQLEEGIYVIGFSYPVVPKGEARIRIQISAAHEPEDLDQAVAAFRKVGEQMNVLPS